MKRSFIEGRFRLRKRIFDRFRFRRRFFESYGSKVAKMKQVSAAGDSKSSPLGRILSDFNLSKKKNETELNRIIRLKLNRADIL